MWPGSHSAARLYFLFVDCQAWARSCLADPVAPSHLRLTGASTTTVTVVKLPLLGGTSTSIPGLEGAGNGRAQSGGRLPPRRAPSQIADISSNAQEESHRPCWASHRPRRAHPRTRLDRGYPVGPSHAQGLRGTPARHQVASVCLLPNGGRWKQKAAIWRGDAVQLELG